MRYTTLIALALILAACEGEVLTPATGFVPTECPPEEPNCEGAFRIDSGLGTRPDTGAAIGEVDAGDPNGGLLDAGDTTPPADSGAGEADAGVSGSPDADPFPDANEPPPEFLNLAGTHDVQYTLDLSDYLLGINGIAGPLDFINRAFMGRLVSGPLGVIVNPLIQNFVAQYVPPWFQTVIDVLSNVASFFERIDVVGVLNIGQDLPIGRTSALHGSERWGRLWVQFINQCPFGYMDRNYPTCAMREIPIAQTGVTPVGPLDVEVTIANFDGVLQAGRPEADFVFNNRSVDMDLYKLLSLVLDLAVRLATNGQVPDLRTALDRIIDCVGLADAVDRALGGNVAARLAVLTTCTNEKSGAIDRIINGIAGVPLGMVSFDFDQHGHAVDRNGNHRADVLQVMTAQDTIDGRFRVLIGADLAGEWAGQNRVP